MLLAISMLITGGQWTLRNIRKTVKCQTGPRCVLGYCWSRHENQNKTNLIPQRVRGSKIPVGSLRACCLILEENWIVMFYPTYLPNLVVKFRMGQDRVKGGHQSLHPGAGWR